MSLEDKYAKPVIVTGGSGLLGSEFIKHLALKGFTPINFDVNNPEREGELFVECDVSNGKSVKESIDKVVADYGDIYGLVNNAYPRTTDWGIKFEDEPFESYAMNVELQMLSVIRFCQQVGAHMKSGSSIVNIASIYGVVGNDPTLYEGTSVSPPAAYSAIKGGIINFSKFLAAQWGHKNIRVNAVSPGGIFNDQDEAFVRRYEKRVPLGRMGRSDDIAPLVSFLISKDAKYITGQNIIVDGGWTTI